VRLIVVEQGLRVLAETEEVAPFLDAFDRFLVNRAQSVLQQLLLGLE
jgi:hypothetical protein